ncbi:MAG TPA: hypothetical protein VI916_02435 [Acidimicrobiia bacterium]|nr:hypothetical protein [Acidimicrobiia bacterium]
MRVTRFLVLAAAVATPTALILPGSQAVPPTDCETPVASAPEFAPGTTNTVTWTAGSSGGFQIEVASGPETEGNGSFVDANLVFVDGSIAATATQYTVSGLAEQTHYFHVRAKTKPQGCNASPWGNVVSTTQDATGPSAEVDSPTVPLVISALDGKVTGTASDAGSGVASVSVAFTPDLLGAAEIRPADGTSTWEVTTAGLAPGLYTVTATATDAIGNTGSPSAAVTIIIV